MLSNQQKALLKRGQREARIEDAEYREILQTITGVSSSTDPSLGDRQFDVLLSCFEAICWRKRDAKSLPMPMGKAVFGQRGYWASKNTSHETSRDRFTKYQVDQEIEALRSELGALGYGPHYCDAILKRIIDPPAYATVGHLWKFKAALERTLKAKKGEKVGAECPF